MNVELSKKMRGQRATGLNSMIIMLLSRMKRKEKMKITVYLNQKTFRQSYSDGILGNNFGP